MLTDRELIQAKKEMAEAGLSEKERREALEWMNSPIFEPWEKVDGRWVIKDAD